eukprot:757683-Rhodomonas_salina.1
MLLRACYAMPGTDRAYNATCLPVLACYAMPGIAYGTIGLCACYAMSGTDLLYGTTRTRTEQGGDEG